MPGHHLGGTSQGSKLRERPRASMMWSCPTHEQLLRAHHVGLLARELKFTWSNQIYVDRDQMFSIIGQPKSWGSLWGRFGRFGAT